MAAFCPICSETVTGDIKTHLMEHFKYKKFHCLGCDKRFYTDNERKLHCDKMKHKRSFQESVNVYLEMMVEMISKDASLIDKLDYSTIVETRKAAIAESSAELDKLVEKQSSNVQTTNRKRTTTGDKEKEGSTSKLLKRKSKTTAQSEEDSTVTTTSNVVENEAPTSSTSRRKSDTEKRNRRSETTPLTLPVVLQRSLIMDTSDNAIGSDVTGFYDPNDPNRRDWSRVTCNECNKEVEYDYMCRKSHVIDKHLPVHEPVDFEEFYKKAMDACYPDLPNSDLACQLCMEGGDIYTSKRREHIEKRHSPNLIDLKCPVNQCGVSYNRQCDLGAHMKSVHKEELSKYKDKEFQDRRKRRNAMISVMTNKCFPMAQFASILKLAKSMEPKPDPTKALEKAKELSEAATYNGFSRTFANDVRVRDLEKTRRAPIYNQTSSSSSSSDEDEAEEENNKKEYRKSTSEDVDEEKLCEDDVVFLSQTFDSQVMQKLKEKNVKSEIRRSPEEEVPAQPEKIVYEEIEEKVEIIPPEIEKTEEDLSISNIPLPSEQEKKKEDESMNNREQREEVDRPRESSKNRGSSTHSERRYHSSHSSSRNRHAPYHQRDSQYSSSRSSHPGDRGPSSSSYSSHRNRNQSTPRSNKYTKLYTKFTPNYERGNRPSPRNY